MKIVTVDSADLKTVLSLLRIYRGVDRSSEHVKSPDAGPLDPFYLARKIHQRENFAATVAGRPRFT